MPSPIDFWCPTCGAHPKKPCIYTQGWSRDLERPGTHARRAHATVVGDFPALMICDICGREPAGFGPLTVDMKKCKEHGRGHQVCNRACRDWREIFGPEGPRCPDALTEAQRALLALRDTPPTGGVMLLPLR